MSTKPIAALNTNHPADWTEKLLKGARGTIRFTPKNDYMFKAVCQTNTYALEGLLAALLCIRQEEIAELKILNPIQLGSSVDEKDCVLDVRVKLNNDHIINIEMQVLFQKDWIDRSLVYLCRSVSTQLKRGEPYSKLMNTIHIGILDFNLFKDNRKFHSRYQLTDPETGHIYTGKFALTVVNLRQIHHATKDDIASGLRDWARLFQATTWEEMMMIAKNNESMRSFTFSLKELSEDEKIQMQCEARERYEHDRASLLEQGYQSGLKKGIQQGIRQEQLKTKKAQDRAEAAEAEIRRLKAELADRPNRG